MESSVFLLYNQTRSSFSCTSWQCVAFTASICLHPWSLRACAEQDGAPSFKNGIIYYHIQYSEGYCPLIRYVRHRFWPAIVPTYQVQYEATVTTQQSTLFAMYFTYPSLVLCADRACISIVGPGRRINTQHWVCWASMGSKSVSNQNQYLVHCCCTPGTKSTCIPGRSVRKAILGRVRTINSSSSAAAA